FSRSLRLRFIGPYRLPFYLLAVDCCADDFFDGGHTVHDLAQAAPAQGDHPVLNGLLLQLQRRGAYQDQFAKFIVESHNLIEAGPSFASGTVALLATLALLRL